MIKTLKRTFVRRLEIVEKRCDVLHLEENMNKDDKLKALDAAITQIEKSYGKGSIMKLGDSGTNMNIETVPTGSISLDIALGLGGVPKGRIIEIYGPESSGKTTVALHMVAEVQKRGGIAGFIDAEHALDPVYAKNIGVDIDNLYTSQGAATGKSGVKLPLPGCNAIPSSKSHPPNSTIFSRKTSSAPAIPNEII